METRNIIDLISKGRNAQAQSAITDLLYVKSGEILSQYKQELGKALFGQEEE